MGDLFDLHATAGNRFLQQQSISMANVSGPARLRCYAAAAEGGEAHDRVGKHRSVHCDGAFRSAIFHASTCRF